MSDKKKVIAFSMWGNIKTYCIGCIKNVIIAKHLFPTWEVWIYYNDSVPKSVIDWLSCQLNVKLIKVDDLRTATSFKEMGQQGMLWRFLPLSDHSVDTVVCRDIDSRLSYYEFVQIERWIAENSKDVLSMIDGYEIASGRKVRGGTCGFRVRHDTSSSTKTHVSFSVEDEIKTVFGSMKEQLPFYSDEIFINHIITKYYNPNSIQIVPRGVRDVIEKVPTCDLFTDYVGEVLDENNERVDKNISNEWQSRRLIGLSDNIEIYRCIKDDDLKMINFLKSFLD